MSKQLPASPMLNVENWFPTTSRKSGRPRIRVELAGRLFPLAGGFTRCRSPHGALGPGQSTLAGAFSLALQVTASAPTPAVIIIEIAKLVEAALQFVGAAALLFGDLPARHVSAPLEVRLGVGHPCGASQAAPEAAGCLGLNNGDAGVHLA